MDALHDRSTGGEEVLLASRGDMCVVVGAAPTDASGDLGEGEHDEGISARPREDVADVRGLRCPQPLAGVGSPLPPLGQPQGEG
eukprot:12423785-Alexandrium_andersonii.AAC.1